MSTIGFCHARIPDSQIDIGPKILLEANADCMVPSPPWAMMGHVFAVDDRVAMEAVIFLLVVVVSSKSSTFDIFD
jgi:hypothetical protein